MPAARRVQLLYRLAKSLRHWPDNQLIRKISLSRYELEMLIGELRRSFNHDETGTDENAVRDLCDYLEYAERIGDGHLENAAKL